MDGHALTGFAVMNGPDVIDRVTGLLVEYLDRPLGLGATAPALSWKVEGTRRGTAQSAYRVLVASSEDLILAGIGDLWDTGLVASPESVGIIYDGVPLRPRQRCWWRVEVHDERGLPLPPSDPSWWEMGLLEEEDWQAQWLEAESEAERGDRETGMHWLMVDLPPEREVVRLRTTFTLPARSENVHVLLLRVAFLRAFEKGPTLSLAIDGVALATDDDQSQNSFEWRVGPPLRAGEHVLDLTVRPDDGAAPDRELSQLAVAAFLRMRLLDGSTFRLSDAGWRYSETGDVVAPAVGYRPPWPAAAASTLRHPFHVTGRVTSARLYTSALGVYEAELNAAPVSGELLAPGFTDYAQLVRHQTFDVTELIRHGENVLAFTVADGWYGGFDGRFAFGPPPRRVRAQLEILCDDGASYTITTGPEWRIAESHIVHSVPRQGEVHDHRLEQRGWQQPGFDDASWRMARVGDDPGIAIVPDAGPPIRVTEWVRPHSIRVTETGTTIVDFGAQLAGWCRLTASGPSGTRIELRFAEVLGEDDFPDFRGMGNPGFDGHPPEIVVLRGDAEGERFEPRFTYRGFRYVEITGLVTALAADDIVAAFVHSDVRSTGTWSSDSSLLNSIWTASRRTFRSNLVSVFTDCPSREQRGWSADAAIAWDAEALAFDTAAFTARQVENILVQQHEDGTFPAMAPMALEDHRYEEEGGVSPAWSTPGVLMPWKMWRHYGSHSILERSWDSLVRFEESIHRDNGDLVWRNRRGWIDWGDWLAPDDDNPLYNPSGAPRTSRAMLGTALWAKTADILAEIAQETGRTQDADHYRERGRSIRAAFVKEFVDATGRVAQGSQTAQAMTLAFELVPSELRTAVFGRLVEDVVAHGHLTTGIVGTECLLDVLVEGGRPDLAYDLLLRREHPSWGHMIDRGATTIWEEWGSTTLINGADLPMSRNHPALGSVVGFLFRRLGGIRSIEPGFARTVIDIAEDPRVSLVSASYDSVRGRFATRWQRDHHRLQIDLTIPGNAQATLRLPRHRGDRVREGEQALEGVAGIEFVTETEESIELTLLSGRYSFTVEEKELFE